MKEKTSYSGLIIENGETEIASVFLFKGGFQELNEFLNECDRKNCRVHFVNEDLYYSKALFESNRMTLGIYANVAAEPKIAEDYMRYLMKLGRGEFVENE